MLDNAGPPAIIARHGEVIRRQVIHADKARAAARRHSADFAVTVASRAFDILDHGIGLSQWKQLRGPLSMLVST
jgi:hypothetical protein